MLKRIALALLGLAALIILLVYGAGRGWFFAHEGPGELTDQPIPAELVASRAEARREAARALGVSSDKQVLFGDLHVHTTVSMDAFFMSLPLVQGEGSHPQADACDFARYCSTLDFWSINDHAESLDPQRWRETAEAIRQCNDVAGDPANPDVAAFLGWEWTQIGSTPDDHYGHKNVVLAHTDAERIPTRPIASLSFSSQLMQGTTVWQRGVLALLARESRMSELARHLSELQDVPPCEPDLHVRDLPENCLESVVTPAELYRKLNEWEHDAIVIPHGTTWGIYTPPGSTWDRQLVGEQHDPERQTLVEVYSGHGNSEEYRDWRAVRFDTDGRAVCPEPSQNYLPPCWRAGQLIEARCLEAGLSAEECAERAAEARHNAASAGMQDLLTVPGSRMQEWLDAGQCRDCFLPSYNYRPGGSVQYIMALRNFEAPGRPRRFEFGFMASSDVHTARPGTGFKELDRREMTEALGQVESHPLLDLRPAPPDPVPRSRAIDASEPPNLLQNLAQGERQASFFLTGGLVAVHSAGRNREAIWQALERKEVYGTSGPRILLWFDLVNAPDPGAPQVAMGGETAMARTPRFSVRAVGSFEQKPGCPEYSAAALSSERLHHICRGECFNPSDERRLITRIEVVRIRPQSYRDEPVAGLIDDPWRVFQCEPDPSGCAVAFSDPEFAAAGRDTLYYVRAIEAPRPAVNAANLRCRYDEQGSCVEVDPCFGDYRTDYQDDCLAETEERAWSSPIFVEYAKP
jgi:hypothetical protein